MFVLRMQIISSTFFGDFCSHVLAWEYSIDPHCHNFGCLGKVMLCIYFLKFPALLVPDADRGADLGKAVVRISLDFS